MNPNPSKQEESFRSKALSFQEAEAILADAGDIALGRTAHRPESTRQSMADVLGSIFMRLAKIKQESELIAPALAEGEEPKITVGILLHELDQEKTQILEQHENIDDKNLNPFYDVSDERLDAIDCLTMYVEAAYNTPREES